MLESPPAYLKRVVRILIRLLDWFWSEQPISLSNAANASAICTKALSTSARFSSGHVTGKVTLYIQLGDLHFLVYFAVMIKLAGPLLVGNSFMDSFVKTSDKLAVFETNWDIERYPNDKLDNMNKTLMFWVGKCVSTASNTEESVPVKTNTAWRIHIAPSQNLMRYRTVLLVTGIANGLVHVPLQILSANFAKKADNVAEMNNSRSWNQHTRHDCPLGASFNHFTRE